jgi:hypothetical protein
LYYYIQLYSGIIIYIMHISIYLLNYMHQGWIQGGGPPPRKLEKTRFLGVKSWFFTRNTPNIFAPPSARRNFFWVCPPFPIPPWLEILDPPLTSYSVNSTQQNAKMGWKGVEVYISKINISGTTLVYWSI